MLRQPIYSRLAGYDDTNDAERLALDPGMRYVAGGRAAKRSAASTSVMSRFETEILAQPKNLELLMNLSGQWVDRVHRRKSLKQIILDMDSSVRDKLIKIGAKVVSHSRYVIFQMAEVAVPQTLFREILDRIRQLRSLTIPARPG